MAGAIEAGGDVTLTAAHNLVLDGTVKAGDLTGNNNKVLTLTAADETITQTSKGAITANEVKTFNSNSVNYTILN